MERVISRFEKAVVVVLICMMMLTVALSALELGFILVKEIMRPPLFFLNIRNLFDIFGAFFTVLIGLELIETIKGYLRNNRIRVEIVFLVAMIAVCRKVIILDINLFPPLVIFGIAALIVALAGGYYLIRNTMTRSPVDSRSSSAEKD